MTIIHTSIEIARTPTEVRAVVLDFARMHKWHASFLKIMKPLPEGKTPIEMATGDNMYLKFLQVGSTFKIVRVRSIKIGLPHPYAKIRCYLYENSEHALTWEGGPALLFHGIHSLTFEPLDGGKATKVINRDIYTGIFGIGAGLPGFKGNVSSLYEGYNRDLKKRCEEIPPQVYL